MLEQVWVGNQANDIVRPDGQIAVKASGKDFNCHVCMVIKVDDSGRIVSRIPLREVWFIVTKKTAFFALPGRKEILLTDVSQTRIDEYYNKRWDDGIPEDQYTVLKGSGLKSKV